MFIVKYRKIFYIFSSILVLASIVAISMWGLNLGIDFKGGTSVEFKFEQSKLELSVVKGRIDATIVTPSLKNSYSLVNSGNDSYILKTRNISETERETLLSSISNNGADKVVLTKFNSIGPALGATSAQKSLVAIALVLICIILFITFAFRHVSEPVSSWKYGLFSIIALCHDVLIPTGVFAVLGHYLGYEVDTLFVTAVLVILGFSIHDTIVVYDRIRENLKVNKDYNTKKNFEQIVGESINQTFIRSLNTSLTTFFAVLMMYVFGPEATKHFSLVLMIGVIFGTYSSIFLASNMLVTAEAFQKEKKIGK